MTTATTPRKIGRRIYWVLLAVQIASLVVVGGNQPIGSLLLIGIVLEAFLYVPVRNLLARLCQYSTVFSEGRPEISLSVDLKCYCRRMVTAGIRFYKSADWGDEPREANTKLISFRRSRLLILGSILLLALFGFLVETAIDDPSKSVFQGVVGAFIVHFGSIFFISVILAITPLAAVYWLACSLWTGRTNVRLTLRRAADPVGIGTMAGFLLGSLVILLHISLPHPRPAASSPGIDLLLNLSLAGAVTGFGLGHLCVVDQASKALDNRITDWILGPVACLGLATVTSVVVNPRSVAGSLIDSYTEGTVLPTGPLSPAQLSDWRLGLLIDKHEVISYLPDRATFIVLVAVACLTFSFSGYLRWVWAAKEARAARATSAVIRLEISLKALSQAANLQSDCLLAFLQGKRSLTFEELTRMSVVAQRSIGWLYGGTEEEVE